jgi:hypothetical protein
MFMFGFIIINIVIIILLSSNTLVYAGPQFEPTGCVQ